MKECDANEFKEKIHKRINWYCIPWGKTQMRLRHFSRQKSWGIRN